MNIVTYPSPIGNLILISRKEKLIGVFFEEQKISFLQEKEEVRENQTEILRGTIHWLDRYFNKENPDINELKIELTGSSFQQRILSILTEIPYGKTRTYKSIAEQVGKEMGKKKMSPQAIGGAVAKNPIAIIIPCHRVVGVNHQLTGYAGGIDRKEKLLEHEGVDLKMYLHSKEKK